jgi:predicted phosphoribosyltransferase
MRAAVRALRDRDAGDLVVGHRLRRRTPATRFVATPMRVWARTPKPFRAVGAGYENFERTSDEEVRATLLRSRGVKRP